MNWAAICCMTGWALTMYVAWSVMREKDALLMKKDEEYGELIQRYASLEKEYVAIDFMFPHGLPDKMRQDRIRAHSIRDAEPYRSDE